MNWVVDPIHIGGPFRSLEIEGQKIAYHASTQFLVQQRSTGSYRTVLDVKGDLLRAYFHYLRIQLQPGHTKRLLMPSCSHHPVLLRHKGV